LFIDADPDQIEASREVGTNAIEIHTGSYCRAAIEGDSATVARELERIIAGARLAASLGLEVHAGHGLDYDNVIAIASIREIVELNIGHHLVGEAVFVGLAASVARMRRVIDGAREALRHSDTEASVGGG
jgi:pyridoxine 5-phosphate synthase